MGILNTTASMRIFTKIDCVNRMNYKAVNFYFKSGFTIEKVADFDIGDGYFMNDFVMIWESIR